MITYEIGDMVTAEELSEVFRRSGIKRPSEDLSRLQRMIDNADVIITARSEGRLIGVARAITDYSYCCYLSDLAVHAEFQNRRVGKKLVDALREHLSDEVSLVLLSAPGAVDFYPKIGFEKSDRAFVIARKK